MAFISKRQVAEHVYADAVVWQCSSCNCWSRNEFVSGDHKCPICKNEMEETTKNIRIS